MLFRSALGSEFGTVDKNMTLLREKLGDIWDTRRSATRAQRIAETAKLYGTDLVTNLESSITGATFAFEGRTNHTFGKQSIFDAAYNTACMDVMFSREALETSAPYIYRQLAIYLAGYATLSEVYDAYEEVYGADKQIGRAHV